MRKFYWQVEEDEHLLCTAPNGTYYHWMKFRRNCFSLSEVGML